MLIFYYYASLLLAGGADNKTSDFRDVIYSIENGVTPDEKFLKSYEDHYKHKRPCCRYSGVLGELRKAINDGSLAKSKIPGNITSEKRNLFLKKIMESEFIQEKQSQDGMFKWMKSFIYSSPTIVKLSISMFPEFLASQLNQHDPQNDQICFRCANLLTIKNGIQLGNIASFGSILELASQCKRPEYEGIKLLENLEENIVSIIIDEREYVVCLNGSVRTPTVATSIILFPLNQNQIQLQSQYDGEFKSLSSNSFKYYTKNSIYLNSSHISSNNFASNQLITVEDYLKTKSEKTHRIIDKFIKTIPNTNGESNDTPDMVSQSTSKSKYSKKVRLYTVYAVLGLVFTLTVVNVALILLTYFGVEVIDFDDCE